MTDTDITIRIARSADAKALMTFFKNEVVPCDLVEFDASTLKMTIAELADQIEAISASLNNLLLVAVADKEVVAYLRIAADNAWSRQHIGELGLVVTTDLRGQGLGTQLMTMALDWRAHSPISRLQLEVQTRNRMAISLYNHFGFIKEGLLAQGYKTKTGELITTELMAIVN